MINDNLSLKQRIKECGLKCNYLASKIGISKSYLSHYLANRKQLDESKVRELMSIIELYEQMNN
jgi:transcriptional regulator with XRE-family HTH domain